MYINKVNFFRIMEKRGLSHLEFVLSFVIFVGFIVFAFIFFNPLQTSRTLTSTMDYAWLEVSEEGKARVDTYSIYINPIASPIIELEIPGLLTTDNSAVEDVNGNILPSFSYTSPGGNRRVAIQRNGNDFFRVKFSPEISNGPTMSGTLLTYEVQYRVSSSKSEELFIEDLLLELNNTYFSDYSGLKQDLNLPNRIDFGFVVSFADSEIVSLNEIPENAEILSRSDKVEIIRSSGKREYGEVRVLVW